MPPLEGTTPEPRRRTSPKILSSSSSYGVSGFSPNNNNNGSSPTSSGNKNNHLLPTTPITQLLSSPTLSVADSFKDKMVGSTTTTTTMTPTTSKDDLSSKPIKGYLQSSSGRKRGRVHQHQQQQQQQHRMYHQEKQIHHHQQNPRDHHRPYYNIVPKNVYHILSTKPFLLIYMLWLVLFVIGYTELYYFHHYYNNNNNNNTTSLTTATTTTVHSLDELLKVGSYGGVGGTEIHIHNMILEKNDDNKERGKDGSSSTSTSFLRSRRDDSTITSHNNNNITMTTTKKKNAIANVVNDGDHSHHSNKTKMIISSTSSDHNNVGETVAIRTSVEDDDPTGDDNMEIVKEERTIGTEQQQEDVGPLLHIIHSRFMQNQPNLVHLGMARLQLLEHLFLKSLVAQSSKNFIVIIRTDPNLHPSLKQPLVDMLHEHQGRLKHLLVASNETPKSQYRDIVHGNILPSMVWSGDFDSIMTYLGVPTPILNETVMTTLVDTTISSTEKNNGRRRRQLSMNDPDDPVVVMDIDNKDGDGDDDNPVEEDIVDEHRRSYKTVRSLGPPPRILETRLDADDALHRFFVETLQALVVGEESPFAIATAARNNNNDHSYNGEGGDGSDGNNNHQKKDDGSTAVVTSSRREWAYDFAPLTWRIWCVDNHAEWQYQPAWKNPTTKEMEEKVGSLISIAVGYCITPGLTIAFLGQDESIAAMPSTSKHEKLMHFQQCSDGPADTNSNGNRALTKDHKRFRHYGSVGPDITSNCRSFFPMAMAALRGRTPTSAGMLNVVVNGTSFNQQYLSGAKKQRKIQDRMWYVVKRLFGFTKKDAKSINEYMEYHMRDIANENLLGQCTTGHSCKQSSQILLKSIVVASNTSVIATTATTITNTSNVSV